MEDKGLHYRYAQLTEDHGSWWVQKLIGIGYGCLRIFSGFIVKIAANIKGVQIGENCRFYGIPYFYRTPKSSITLGNNCRLRSESTSNLIGINHKCIISTLTSDAIIKIGNNCGMSGVSIGAAKEIIIGDNVLIGANCIITDNDWHSVRHNSKPATVIIHDNAWIGVNSVILKGVEIGENSIIGANSLVVKSIPPNVVAGGNPCKILKKNN